MRKMINKITGTVMYVDDSRFEEYRGMGHRSALPATLEEMGRKEEPTELEKAVKRVSRKKKV